MITEGRKSINGFKNRKLESVIDAIAEHAEKNSSYEFVRILEQFSKMDDVGKKKLMDFAQKLAE